MGSDIPDHPRFQAAKTKTHAEGAWGETVFTGRQGGIKLAGHVPNRVSLSIKEGFHYVQRVRTPHRGSYPSSAIQLPILTALHARSPTLFKAIIHEEKKKVNRISCFSHN